MNKETNEPCQICGCTDLYLEDGFYYCVECGTQDITVRETVVENVEPEEGMAVGQCYKKKIPLSKPRVQMSAEWNKWHYYNFILCGLADELIELGAKPSFKEKVLWIWTRYIKKYQKKNEIGNTNISNDETRVLSDGDSEEHIDCDDDDDIGDDTKKRLPKNRIALDVITKALFICILYVALNMDHSPIQLSHLCRFIIEGRVSLTNYARFIPKEMNKKNVPNKCFKLLMLDRMQLNKFGEKLIRELKLGVLSVPDMRQIINNHITELCLPESFKNFVFSLTHLVPYDFEKHLSSSKKSMPDFEAVAMAYIVVGLKICFGLDDDYEIRLSDVVDKVNEECDYPKSHKIGNYSQSTDRLFSFRDWSHHLQFRKLMLCKYNLHVAAQYDSEVDNIVLMESIKRPKVSKPRLCDFVTMDIINDIHDNFEVNTIPFDEFGPTLTPMSEYTQVILQYLQDPEKKLLISEDFSKYSLKYVCEDIQMDCFAGIVCGIKSEKTIAKSIELNENKCQKNNFDWSMVYVRNCENKNWMTTKKPSKNHIVENEDDENKELAGSVLTCDENQSAENTKVSLETENVINSATQDSCNINDSLNKIECIKEELDGIEIYDDLFDDVDEKPNILNIDNNIIDSKENTLENIVSDSASEYSIPHFNPLTFNRKEIIKELILESCKRYKVAIPREYKDTILKRKTTLKDTEASERKRKKSDVRIHKDNSKLNDILSAYYSNLNSDALHQLSAHVTSLITNTEQYIQNNTSNIIDNEINETTSAQVQIDDDNSNGSLKSDHSGSVQEINNSEFDENTHDTKQLYLRLLEDAEFEEIDDSKLNKIIDDKIGQIGIDEKSNHENGDKTNGSVKSHDSSISLALLKYKKQREQKLHHLIKNSKKLKQYNCWFKHMFDSHYKRNIMFDAELHSKWSNSYKFVITQCASIILTRTSVLNYFVQYIEKLLLRTLED